MATFFDTAATMSRWYDDRTAARRAFVLAMLLVSLLGWLAIHMVVVDTSVDTFVRYRTRAINLPSAIPPVAEADARPDDGAQPRRGGGDAGAHRSLPGTSGEIYRPVLTLIVPNETTPPARFDDIASDDVGPAGGVGIGPSGSDGGGPGGGGGVLGGVGGGVVDTVVDDDDFLASVDVEAAIDLDRLRSRIVYPEVARRLRQEGRVVVKVWIAPDGTLARVSVAGSAGAALDAAALAAVEGMTATPARQGSRTVGTWMYIPVMFVLP